MVLKPFTRRRLNWELFKEVIPTAEEEEELAAKRRLGSEAADQTFDRFFREAQIEAQMQAAKVDAIFLSSGVGGMHKQ